MKKVIVVWMWYVWFPLSCAISRSQKYEVVWIDIDTQKIEKINNGLPPIDDEIGEKDLQDFPFRATERAQEIRGAKYVIVCVPTPVKNHTPNLIPLKLACKMIADHLEKGQNIIIESTINPWICDEVVIPILEETWLNVGKDFEVAHCPERINPWDPKWNVYNIARNVWATTKEWTKKVADFYRSFLKAEVYEMKDIKHTEATKIIENTFRDINIAYVNELAKSFDIFGIDIVEVINGAKNKPFAFMPHYPSCWVWGHCIPVDPYYLIEKAKKVWFDHKFLSLAREINNSMPEYVTQKLMLWLNDLEKSIKGTKVALLWLSYKKDIADTRESPALDIKKYLEKYGAIVDVYEPHNLVISQSQSFEEALEKNEVVCIATNHSIFMNELYVSNFEKHNILIVLDGKNCLDKKSFSSSKVKYIWVGR